MMFDEFKRDGSTLARTYYYLYPDCYQVCQTDYILALPFPCPDSFIIIIFPMESWSYLQDPMTLFFDYPQGLSFPYFYMRIHTLYQPNYS